MFQSVIDIREDTPQDILNSLIEIANKAFDNRAGKVENTSKIPYRLIYRGEDNLFSCLQLGCLHWKTVRFFRLCDFLEMD